MLMTANTGVSGGVARRCVDGPLPDHPRAVVLGTGAVLDDAVAGPQLVVEELAVVLVYDVERVPARPRARGIRRRLTPSRRQFMYLPTKTVS